MDVNNFYKEVFEETLGLDVLGLESTYQQLVKLVETKTLITFSNYIPALYKFRLDISEPKNVVRDDLGTYGVEFYLEDPVLEKFHLPILGIEKVEYTGDGAVDPYDPNSTNYYSSVITSRNNLTLDAVLMGSEYTYNRTLTDFAMPWKKYHEYRGGNILYLKNYAYESGVEVTVKTQYPNLTSIPEEYREIFIKLAVYDIRIYLWNWLRYMENIVTPAGNLDLKFDWSGAESEREDYLKDLRSKSFYDRVGPRFFQIV